MSYSVETTSKEVSVRGEATRTFNEILCQATDKTLEQLLGEKVVEAVYVLLREKFGVDRNELPYRIDTLCSVLQSVFGVKSTRVIERRIAKNLYDRILLPFDDQQVLTLEDFIKQAKETISRDNYYT